MFKYQVNEDLINKQSQLHRTKKMNKNKNKEVPAEADKGVFSKDKTPEEQKKPSQFGEYMHRLRTTLITISIILIVAILGRVAWYMFTTTPQDLSSNNVESQQKVYTQEEVDAPEVPKAIEIKPLPDVAKETAPEVPKAIEIKPLPDVAKETAPEVVPKNNRRSFRMDPPPIPASTRWAVFPKRKMGGKPISVLVHRVGKNGKEGHGIIICEDGADQEGVRRFGTKKNDNDYEIVFLSRGEVAKILKIEEYNPHWRSKYSQEHGLVALRIAKQDLVEQKVAK